MNCSKPCALVLLLFALTAHAEKIALVGGTAINPSDGQMIADAMVVTDGDRIESIATRNGAGAPAGAKTIDCTGKFILPGYIDTHVHFF